jgi:tRNA pseudouridine38-40 synthase
VAAELLRAMEVLMKRTPEVVVAGRTDAGVHALGQVVSYEGEVLPLRSLNALLPPDVGVMRCEEAADGFNARFDARSRTYLYRLHTRRGKESPFERGRALWWPHRVDRDALHACAAALPGEHDFTAFTPTQNQHRTFNRTVMHASWSERPEGLEFRIQANAFLRNMNRVLVATMLEVSSGRRTLEDFVSLLDGAPRARAAATAAPHGLFLHSVEYADTVGR